MLCQSPDLGPTALQEENTRLRRESVSGPSATSGVIQVAASDQVEGKEKLDDDAKNKTIEMMMKRKAQEAGGREFVDCSVSSRK